MKKLAIPIAGGRLCTHFGHCESFSLVEIDEQERRVVQVETLQAPPHEPGLLPEWLARRGVDVVIAGGMGSRAKELFAERGIRVVTGADSLTPEELAGAYMEDSLRIRGNACDH